MIKVENMISNKGNAIANQFIIRDGNNIFFQSYKSLIAKWDLRNLTLGKHWDYSRTTSKYLHQFLTERVSAYYDMSASKMRELIKKGEVTYDENMI